MGFYAELKRRNVFRVGIAYVVITWVLLQGADFGLDLIEAPNWVVRALVLLAALGLPPVLVFAWVFEMTPEGLRREKDLDRSQSITPQTGRRLDRVIITLLGLAVVVLLARQVLQAPTGATVPVPAPSVPAVESVPQSVSGQVSIAVLPFVNMSSDPEQDYFSDGITEEILNRLAGIKGLQVAARTSAFSFKGQNRDVREIARLLGVGNILEGSVRKAGDEVRITAQLIRAGDGFHLWSETYDRRLENIFDIQDDIAGHISESLQVSLGVESSAGADPSVIDPRAYDLYLRGRALHRQRGEGLLRALDLFQQALAIEPEFAAAWAGLAHTYIVIPNYISTEQFENLGDVMSLAEQAAERALMLDPELPSAQHAMGNVRLFQHRWGEAEQHYLRALDMDPDSADIMEDYVSLLTHSWQFETASAVAERMLDLDPFVPVFMLAAANLNRAQGHFETVDSYLDRILELSPGLINVIQMRLDGFLQQRRFDEAIDFAAGLEPGIIDPDHLRALVEWLENPRSDAGPAARAGFIFFSSAALMADRLDLWLELVTAEGALWPEWEITATVNLIAPTIEPGRLSRYRSDPRVTAWLNRLGLPDYWREVGWPEYCSAWGGDDFECH
jgi:TolB-like protein/Tfp pilus assembly protein PilF